MKLRYIPLAWSAVLMTSLTFITFRAIGLNIYEICKTLGISHSWTLALVIYDIYQLVTVILLVMLLRKEGIILRDIGFKKFKKVSIKYYVLALIPFLIVPFIWDFCVFIVTRFELTMLWWSSNDIVAPIKTPIDLLILTVFPILFCLPLEEIMYRGYILNALTSRINTVLAVLIDSLIFASIHYAYGIGTMLFILFCSFIPCLLYLKTKSLYPISLRKQPHSLRFDTVIGVMACSRFCL